MARQNERATTDDLPIVLNRLAMIEELAPQAMNEMNYDAFAGAHEDSSNIADRFRRQLKAPQALHWYHFNSSSNSSR
jgi:hypothetical protein